MKRALLLLLFAALAPPARGDFNSASVGTSTGQFLKLGADARGVGMGQAMSAVAEDATALYWNPAGLSQLRERQATFTHAIYLQSVFYDFLAYANPVKLDLTPSRRRDLKPSGLGTWAAGLFYLNSGELKEIDNTGTPTGGAFTPRDLALLAAWGSSLNEYIDVGIGLKYIDSRIEDSARTEAFDAGARLRWRVLDFPYVASLSAYNLGGKLKFQNHADPLPVSFRLGQSLRPLPQWIISADMVFPRDNGFYPNFGTEFQLPIEPDMSVALRGGFSALTNSSDLNGLTGVSFGMGLGLKGAQVDYAWLPFGVLGQTHRFSLSYRF